MVEMIIVNSLIRRGEIVEGLLFLDCNCHSNISRLTCGKKCQKLVDQEGMRIGLPRIIHRKRELKKSLCLFTRHAIDHSVLYKEDYESHSFISNLPDDRSKASSKTIPPLNAI
jgi:hypothetical protein